MKTLIFSILSLGTGFGIGYFVSHKITKEKYCNLADKEVSSVKKSLEEYYESKMAASKDSNSAPTENKKEECEPIKRAKADVSVDIPVDDLIGKDSINYEDLKQNNEEKAYKKYAKPYKPSTKKTVKKVEKEDEPGEEPLRAPYVITPEEYTDGEYDVKTLTYYADGVLADDEFNVIKDVKGYVGNEALNSFGVYEQDIVYVRNDKYKIDYEIIFDEREFRHVAPKGTTTYEPDDED